MSKHKCGSNPVAPKTLIDTTIVGGSVIGAELLNTKVARSCEGKDVVSGTPIVTCADMAAGAAISKDPGNPISKGSDGRAFLSDADLLAKMRKLLDELISKDDGNTIEIGDDGKLKVSPRGVGLPWVGECTTPGYQTKVKWWFVGLTPGKPYMVFIPGGSFTAFTHEHMNTHLNAFEIVPDEHGAVVYDPDTLRANRWLERGETVYRYAVSPEAKDPNSKANVADALKYLHPMLPPDTEPSLLWHGKEYASVGYVYEKDTKQVVGRFDVHLGPGMPDGGTISH